MLVRSHRDHKSWGSMPANLAKRVPAKPDNGAVVAVAVGPGACPTKSIRWWRVVGGEEVDGGSTLTEEELVSVSDSLAEEQELVSVSGDWILFRLRLGWGGCSCGCDCWRNRGRSRGNIA